jgi:hypothetical protein
MVWYASVSEGLTAFIFYPEDGDSMMFQNFGTHLVDYIMHNAKI